MSTEQTQIIEINGIKLEVDLRHARRIDSFKVGDPVKILVVSNYAGSEPEVHSGVIADFEQFESLPTIVVAYVTTGYNTELKFAHVNARTAERYQLVPANTDTLLALDKGYVVDRMDRDIAKKETELQELQARKRFFLERFGRFFEASQPA